MYDTNRFINFIWLFLIGEGREKSENVIFNKNRWRLKKQKVLIIFIQMLIPLLKFLISLLLRSPGEG